MYQCTRHKGLQYCRSCECPLCAEEDCDDDDISEVEWVEDELRIAFDEGCGMRPDGTCGLAGTEHCDFDCQLRGLATPTKETA